MGETIHLMIVRLTRLFVFVSLLLTSRIVISFARRRALNTNFMYYIDTLKPLEESGYAYIGVIGFVASCSELWCF